MLVFVATSRNTHLDKRINTIYCSADKISTSRGAGKAVSYSILGIHSQSAFSLSAEESLLAGGNSVPETEVEETILDLHEPFSKGNGERRIGGFFWKVVVF